MDQAEEKPLRSLFADILVEAGIDHVFGMPGGCTPFLFDGLFDKKEQINTVLVRNKAAPPTRRTSTPGSPASRPW
jgi:hypothetical protein